MNRPAPANGDAHLRVLHLETSLNWGGQEFRTLDEIRWFNRNGHRAWLVCQPDSEIRRRAEEMKIPHLALPMARGLNLSTLRQIGRLLRRERIDVIHTHSPKDSWISFPLHLAGRPVVRSRHVSVAGRMRFRRAFFFRHGQRRLIAAAASIRDDLVRRCRVRPEKIVVVGEGVDLQKFHPAVDGAIFRKQWQIPQDAPLVGMLGMVRKEKGQLEFIEAALLILKANPDVRFVLAGAATALTRPYAEQCRARLAEAGAAILMPGYLEDAPAFLAALDLVVVPSLAEAQSRVVPEAFAMRKPVIASRVGGLPELIEDGVNGLLVPPGDSAALAHAIQRLLSDPALREKLAQVGYQKARTDLSFDRMMRETLAVYRSALTP
jgi:glycosyltransferase involved in cell wall biosynthesis